MTLQDEVLQVYRDLAEWYERHGQPQMRDRFLMLAADAALTAARTLEAERLRQRLLHLNPQHLLRPYQSMAQALQAPDVQIYLRDLRTNYPLETARDLLRNVRASEGLPPRAESEAVDLGGQTWHEPGEQPLDQTAALPPLAARPRPASGRPSNIGDPPAPRGRSSELGKPKGGPAPSAPRRPPEADLERTARPAPLPGRGQTPSYETNETAALPPGGVPLRNRTPMPEPQPAPRGVPAHRPAPLSVPAAEPAAPLHDLRPRDEADAGGWLSVVLFGLVALAGIAVAVFTLGRPFLPMP
jgi:hypothetical protein